MPGDKWTYYLVFTDTSQGLLVAFIRKTWRVKLWPINLPRVLVKLVSDPFPKRATYIKHSMIIDKV